uniref:Uncharacterized protein n=1 Tax=Anguilla anguilla TaxID=7936 RepID=A0A0E9TJ35_ANGAN
MLTMPGGHLGCFLPFPHGGAVDALTGFNRFSGAVRRTEKRWFFSLILFHSV